MGAQRALRRSAAVVVVAAAATAAGVLGSRAAEQAVTVAAAPHDWTPSPPAASATTAAPPGTTATSLPPPDPATAPYSIAFDGTVRLRVLTSTGLGVGTGFAVGDGTWIVTNQHVTSEAQRIEVETWDGERLADARFVAAASDGSDLALLRVEGPALDAIELREGRVLRGEDITTAGYPGGRRFVRTPGSANGYARTSDGTMLLMDIPCEPGCSGSPVVDAANRLVGVLAGGADTGETLAVPVERVRHLLDEHGL